MDYFPAKKVIPPFELMKSKRTVWSLFFLSLLYMYIRRGVSRFFQPVLWRFPSDWTVPVWSDETRPIGQEPSERTETAQSERNRPIGRKPSGRPESVRGGLKWYRIGNFFLKIFSSSFKYDFSHFQKHSVRSHRFCPIERFLSVSTDSVCSNGNRPIGQKPFN